MKMYKRTVQNSIIPVLVLILLISACGAEDSHVHTDSAEGCAGAVLLSVFTESALSEKPLSEDLASRESASEGSVSDGPASDDPVSEESDYETSTTGESDSKGPASEAPDSESFPSGQPDSKGSSSDPAPEEASSDVFDSTAEAPYMASPSVSGALQVNGTQLADKNGQAVQLKGISTHGLAWFPQYVNAECFRQLRDEWNINVIRLAMYTAEYGGYCSGGDQAVLKELIRSGVDYAAQLDMYVILDWHILSDGNPNTYLDQSKDFFREMAQAFASYDNVLYEICNEPNGGTAWSDVRAYAQEVIPVIRDQDEDGIIIVGTPNWCQYVDQAAADPLSGYDNIMYSLHFYAATHTDSLRSAMTSAIDAGLPIFVSEYGICDASGNGSINESQARQWIDTMDQYGVSYVAWNLSNKNETSSILSGSCSKTSGFTQDDLSASGRWLFDMLTGESSSDTFPEPPRQDPKQDAAQPSSPPEHAQTPLPPEDADSANISVSFSAKLINSWESQETAYYQYELILENTSGTDCTSWVVDIPFSEAFTLSDCWNGEYTVSGQTLHITNKDYNGSIPSGGSVNNIGFIVSGSRALTISQ